MTEIFAFGDSITWGAFDSEGGWIQRLRKCIENKNGRDVDFVYNLGIPGNKTPDILNRFEFETAQRSNPTEKDKIIIFGVGGNDASYSTIKKDNKINKTDFEANLIKIIEKAKKITNNLLFVGLIQHNEKKSCPIPWSKTSFYYNKYQKEYNEIIKTICLKYKIGFLDVINEFEDPVKNDLLDSDGLHPNDKGHKIIFEKLTAYLTKNKLI